MQLEQLINQSKPFLEWLLEWQTNLKPLSLASVIQDAPRSTGIISVDVIEGFCHVGPLSSPRVRQIIEPITALFNLAWQQGVRDIALPQDTHPANAVEFAQYAPHCIRGTQESQTVDAFKRLPFFEHMTIIEKNSINSGLTPAFNEWITQRNHIKNWIIVGDCTDLCTYQLAMHMRLRANENQMPNVRVIVPVNTVDTYDLPVETAAQIGAVPHPAPLLHLIFLYHMMLNGVEIVTEITS